MHTTYVPAKGLEPRAKLTTKYLTLATFSVSNPALKIGPDFMRVNSMDPKLYLDCKILAHS